jgi:uncharacterized RDD family membrane protein YckC
MADFSPPGAVGGGASGPSGPRAGFGVRFLALLIDSVIVGVVGLVLRLALGVVGIVLQLVLSIGYYVYLEGSPSGQTIGKRAMNIRVVDFLTGGPLGPSKAFIRWIGRLVSGFVCLLGYFWMLWDQEKQTWHDKLAGTVVVPTSAYPVTAWPG